MMENELNPPVLYFFIASKYYSSNQLNHRDECLRIKNHHKLNMLRCYMIGHSLLNSRLAFVHPHHITVSILTILGLDQGLPSLKASSLKNCPLWEYFSFSLSVLKLEKIKLNFKIQNSVVKNSDLFNFICQYDILIDHKPNDLCRLDNDLF